MMKLYGRTDSSNVQKVLWALDEFGVEYEFEQAGAGFGKTGEAWFLELNPNGLVPTLVDEGRPLWESHAILRYLATRQDGAVPAMDRAIADQWMEWASTNLTQDMRTVFVGYIKTPPAERDLPALEAAVDRAAGFWRILDRHLATNAFVAGARFGVGDIPLGILAHRWLACVPDHAALPHLERWMAGLRDRAGFVKFVSRSF